MFPLYMWFFFHICVLGFYLWHIWCQNYCCPCYHVCMYGNKDFCDLIWYASLVWGGNFIIYHSADSRYEYSHKDVFAVIIILKEIRSWDRFIFTIKMSTLAIFRGILIPCKWFVTCTHSSCIKASINPLINREYPITQITTRTQRATKDDDSTTQAFRRVILLGLLL